MLRTLFAIVSGLFAMMIVITTVEIVNAKYLFPPPPGLDLTNAETIANFASTMPTGALAIVLLGWLLGVLVGASVAAWIATRHRMACALAIGAVDVVLTAANAVSIPHPTWVMAAGILLPIPLAWLAAKWVQKGFASTR